jgi:phage replication-related protein YjqB (UPF0714/DUF867 family)
MSCYMCHVSNHFDETNSLKRLPIHLAAIQLHSRQGGRVIGGECHATCVEFLVRLTA